MFRFHLYYEVVVYVRACPFHARFRLFAVIVYCANTFPMFLFLMSAPPTQMQQRSVGFLACYCHRRRRGLDVGVCSRSYCGCYSFFRGTTRLETRATRQHLSHARDD